VNMYVFILSNPVSYIQVNSRPKPKTKAQSHLLIS
jgi:hypothetical protein